MATKSILKDIDIKDKELCKSLIVALENAKNKHSKEVTLSRTFEEAHGDRIIEVLKK